MSDIRAQVVENAATAANKNAEMLEEMLRGIIVNEAPKAIFDAGKKMITSKAVARQARQDAFNKNVRDGVLTGVIAGSMFGGAGIVANAINRSANNNQF